jgi:two-component system phosphate regulon sensor histidine kinase PhoR
VHRLFFLAVFRVVLLSALLGALLGFWLGPVFGIGASAVVILIGFAYHAWKLAQLSQWIESSKRPGASAADVPDGFGTWGEVLAQLYRLFRQQRVDKQSLSDSLSRFQQAAAALPDGAVMLDDQFNLVWCNPTAESHWQISLERDRLQTITYFIRSPEFKPYLESRRFHEPLTLRIPRAQLGGKMVELTLAVQLVPFGQDQMLLLSRDISERERLEAMRRDFVANVSHELRTPLTVLAGFVETLTNASDMRPEILARSLRHMTAQSQRMQSLVEDLLTLSRLEDAQNKLTPTIVDMCQLLESIVEDARHLSAGRHTIRTELSPAWLSANRDEIASALTNLVTNAVRYTPDHGEIVVTQSISAEGELRVRVRDNGEGIAPEHIPRLTERFYRVDRGRSRAAGGTGLGLAIVKHVLIRHGASLNIESTQKEADHGSTFELVFPALRVSSVAPDPQLRVA